MQEYEYRLRMIRTVVEAQTAQSALLHSYNNTDRDVTLEKLETAKLNLANALEGVQRLIAAIKFEPRR